MYSSDELSHDILKLNPKIKPNSTVTDYQKRQSDPNTQLLEEKLSILQHQYGKMETEYIQKIRQLKNTLLQKSRRQVLLSGEITFLRQQFKHHQEEICKVSQQLTNEGSKEVEVKPQKKNSSPGLIKKSLEIEKKHEKKVSPGTHSTNTNFIIQNVVANKSGQNSSPTSKRASPKNSSPGLLRLLKNQQPQAVTSKKLIVGSEHNETKQAIQKSSGDHKKAYSPSSSQSIKIGLPNAKQDGKLNTPPAGTNPSPKRFIRRSPAQKGPAQVQSKKDGKQLLGKLKQTMQEVF